MKELENALKRKTKNIEWIVKSEIVKATEDSSIMVDTINIQVSARYLNIHTDYYGHIWVDDDVDHEADYIATIVVGRISHKLFFDKELLQEKLKTWKDFRT